MHSSTDAHTIITSLTNRHWLRVPSLAAVLLTLAPEATRLLSVDESTHHCGVAFEANATYPPLPDVEGPDILDEPGVLVHLQRYRGVVELGDCLYELNRPLELGFIDLSEIELLFDLPGAELGARVFVTEGERPAVDYEVYGGTFAYTMTADAVLGFEVAPLLQMAPTVPIVVTRPREEDPEPN